MNEHLADYNSRPIEIAGGDGCRLYGADGKKYLDFIAGWCVGNVGWNRSEIRDAIVAEAERGRYVPQFFRMKEQEEFAARLCELAPNPELVRVFRCTSGSEAVEFAIKCARAATGRKTIVSIDGVYHGHTYGAASVGDACSSKMAPCPPGFLKLSPAGLFGKRSADDLIGQFEKLLDKNRDIAAFLSEPVWTNAGAYVPPPHFYPAIEKLCRGRGVLLVMDEVATGFGRCGKLFASELWGLKPDIVCLAKGLTGGYGTMGATLVTEEIYERSRGIPSYSTFGWVPTDLAAARTNLEVIIRDRLWENAERVGGYLLERLKTLKDLPHVGEVRGAGLTLGVDIVSNKMLKTPDYKRSVRLQDACAEAGLLLETAGHALFMTPPLILDEKTADEGFEILREVLANQH